MATLVREHFDLTPRGIISSLKLLNPIYQVTSYHGHFGRQPGEGVEGAFSWEKTDKADVLRSAVNDHTPATATA